MEELQARHQKERRDLQCRITQKKKAASKKTRKGVNSECEELERELKEKHDQELAGLNGGCSVTPVNGEEAPVNNTLADNDSQPTSGLEVAGHAPDDSSEAPAATGAGPARKPNRQKARLARRAAALEAQATEAAEEAAKMPDPREQERLQIASILKQYSLQEKEIRPDGHCLYSAIADQLTTVGRKLLPAEQDPEASASDGDQGDLPPYKLVRQATANHVRQQPAQFEPFLEEALESYTHKIGETAEWGGHLELTAMSQLYGVKIKIVQGDGRIETIEPGIGASEYSPTLWLAYHRHHYGLGEHYNSLRPKVGNP